MTPSPDLHRLLTDEEAHAEIDIPIAQIEVAIFQLLGAWKQRRQDRRVVVKAGIGLALGVDKEFGKTSKRYLVHDPGLKTVSNRNRGSTLMSPHRPTMTPITFGADRYFSSIAARAAARFSGVSNPRFSARIIQQ